MVEEGKPAPDFELPSDGGETMMPSEMRGKVVAFSLYLRDRL